MIKFFISLTLGLGTFILFGQVDPRIQLAKTWLEAQYQYDQLPGISVAIVEDQEILWSHGFGEAAPGVPTQDNTIYSICSISKLFTSIGIMQLRDAGKIRLDEPISTYLPWFDLKQQYDDSGPITIRSLLTHSSGLPRESDHPYWTGPDFPFPSTEEIISNLKNQQTLYPASTYFQYSNLGLTLLGEIIREVSDQDYSTYIEEHILSPLQMKDTRTYMPGDLFGNQLAKGYSAQYRDGSRTEVELFDANGIAAAAGFSSTVLDLAKFAMWQFRVLQGSSEEHVLKKSTLKEMQRVHWLDPDWDTSWGLGFSVYQIGNETFVGHGGSCPGYRSTISMNPQKQKAAIAMINASGTNPARYASALHKIWAKSDAKPDSLDLSQYEGLYSVQPWWSESYILQWGDDLIEVSLPSNDPTQWTTLRHIEVDIFRRVREDDALGEAYIFEKDRTGKISHYTTHNNLYRKIE